MKKLFFFIVILILSFNKSFAYTNYVWQGSSSPTPPYTNWTTAAHKIQGAVNYAVDGNLVLVRKGVYDEGGRITPGFATSNRVLITKNITLSSVNHPESTIIVGAPGTDKFNYDSIRCVFMTAGVLKGFVISNGYTGLNGNMVYDASGGGVWLTNGCVVTNCTIVCNAASWGSGGGVYCLNGGTVASCVIISNQSSSHGGGVAIENSGNVIECEISKNIASIYGGGARCINGGSIFNCDINNNTAKSGGGIHCNDNSSILNCQISKNTATDDGGGVYCSDGSIAFSKIFANSAVENGGGVFFSYGGALTNCLIYGINSADYGAGVYVNNGGYLYNCTIAGNNANVRGGGLVCHNQATIINSIIYENHALIGDNNCFVISNIATISYCCTAPTNGLPICINCISSNPLFLNSVAEDYELQGGSPCIDAGFNMLWMTSAEDLAGNPRINDGTVDMGCYEYVPEPALSLFIIFIIMNLHKSRCDDR